MTITEIGHALFSLFVGIAVKIGGVWYKIFPPKAPPSENSPSSEDTLDEP